MTEQLKQYVRNLINPEPSAQQDRSRRHRKPSSERDAGFESPNEQNDEHEAAYYLDHWESNSFVEYTELMIVAHTTARTGMHDY